MHLSKNSLLEKCVGQVNRTNNFVLITSRGKAKAWLK